MRARTEHVRVLLIKASLPQEWPINPPLGVAYLSSTLKAWSKFPVVTRIVNMEGRSADPACLNDVLSAFDPHVVGISCVTYEAPLGHAVADHVKAWKRDVPVVMGGPYVTSDPKGAASNPNVDAAVVGEGERAFVDLVERFIEGGYGTRPLRELIGDVAGIAYRDTSLVEEAGAKGKGRFELLNPQGIIETPQGPYLDLDAMPFPDWHGLWDDLGRDFYNRYSTFVTVLHTGRRMMGITSSRGCPYRCTYCHNIFGKSSRLRSAESVIAEMEALYKEGVYDFHFVDDIFNIDGKRAERVCELILQKGLKKGWHGFPNGIRADIVQEHHPAMYKEAGWAYICYAVETGSPRLQRYLKKHVKLERAMDIIRRTSNAGIITGCYFMIGFPTETAEEMEETYRYAADPAVDLPSTFVAVPQFGTELHKQAADRGLVRDGTDLSAFQYVLTPTHWSELPDDEFASIRRRFMDLNDVALDRFPLRAKLQQFGMNRFQEITKGAVYYSKDDRVAPQTTNRDPAVERLYERIVRLAARTKLDDKWTFGDVRYDRTQVLVTLNNVPSVDRKGRPVDLGAVALRVGKAHKESAALYHGRSFNLGMVKEVPHPEVQRAVTFFGKALDALEAAEQRAAQARIGHLAAVAGAPAAAPERSAPVGAAAAAILTPVARPAGTWVQPGAAAPAADGESGA